MEIRAGFRGAASLMVARKRERLDHDAKNFRAVIGTR
jgi:hypothetical protein